MPAAATCAPVADPLPYGELRAAGVDDLAPVPVGTLRQPGMKLLHVADLDVRRDRTMASGAQIVSTEYITRPNVFGIDYRLPAFVGGWRCNPLAKDCAK